MVFLATHHPSQRVLANAWPRTESLVVELQVLVPWPSLNAPSKGGTYRLKARLLENLQVKEAEQLNTLHLSLFPQKPEACQRRKRESNEHRKRRAGLKNTNKAAPRGSMCVEATCPRSSRVTHPSRLTNGLCKHPERKRCLAMQGQA